MPISEIMKVDTNLPSEMKIIRETDSLKSHTAAGSHQLLRSFSKDSNDVVG